MTLGSVRTPSLPGGVTLVTGASGFIGSRVLERLRNGGASVHAVSRQPAPSGVEGVRWWRQDLADISEVRSLIDGVRPDVILHLASHVAGARDLALVLPTFADNLTTTVNLLTVAAERGCRRFVLTGSMEEPVGELDAVPCSPYAAAKFAASAYARMFHALFDLPTVVLRVFMVYGPGQRDVRKLVPYTILALLRGQAPRLMSGTREVDWVFVDDVVDAVLAAASGPGVDGQIVDVGAGVLVSVKQIVERLVALVDASATPLFGEVPDRPLEQVRVADTARTAALLGWRPSVSLDDGLRRTVDWYRAQATGS